MTEFLNFRTCPQSGLYLNVRVDDFTSVLPRDCNTLLAPRSPHQSGYIKGNGRNPCAHVYTPNFFINHPKYEIQFHMKLCFFFRLI